MENSLKITFVYKTGIHSELDERKFRPQRKMLWVSTRPGSQEKVEVIKKAFVHFGMISEM